MKIENLKVYNFEGAFRGMRNPYDSWDKSDSYFGIDEDYYVHCELTPDIVSEYLDKARTNNFNTREYCDWFCRNCILNSDAGYVEYAFIGPDDMELAQRLILAGPEHRKFLRQITVSFDITAPLYWWKEFDTYKVGTVANSCSTMHTLKDHPITLDRFEIEDFENIPFPKEYQRPEAKSDCDDNFIQMCLIPYLESLRVRYNETGDKKYWKELVRWLPEGWLQTRTVTMSYETLYNICHQRKGHRLTEWHTFIDWVKKNVPYAYELIFLDELKQDFENNKIKENNNKLVEALTKLIEELSN